MNKEVPIFDKNRLIRQFYFLTKHFDLDCSLTFTNEGPTGNFNMFSKRITINVNKPLLRFDNNSIYFSWSNVLCHEIRHAIQSKYRWVYDDLTKGERIYKGKIVFKIGDIYTFEKYLNQPEEVDARKFADKWEKKLIRLGY